MTEQRVERFAQDFRGAECPPERADARRAVHLPVREREIVRPERK